MMGSRKIETSKIRLSWGLDIVGWRDPTRRDLVQPHSTQNTLSKSDIHVMIMSELAPLHQMISDLFTSTSNMTESINGFTSIEQAVVTLQQSTAQLSRQVTHQESEFTSLRQSVQETIQDSMNEVTHQLCTLLQNGIIEALNTSLPKPLQLGHHPPRSPDSRTSQTNSLQ
jgi:hypothetical protein